jgi:hypothetical protein
VAALWDVTEQPRREKELMERVDSFFPPRAGEAAMLEEGVGDHCHERMTMKAGPRSPSE